MMNSFVCAPSESRMARLTESREHPAHADGHNDLFGSLLVNSSFWDKLDVRFPCASTRCFSTRLSYLIKKIIDNEQQ
jgi:hypothetical protein